MITARSNGVLIKKKPFKVLVCLVTLVAFIFNTVSFNLTWAVGTPSALPGSGSDRAGGSGSLKELHVDTFTLPEYLGQIKDQFKANNSDKIVVHIQDAHCNYAAQHKISEIIEYLNKEYGIDTVNLEGGTKDYDLSIFTNIPDKPIRQKVADYFVKEGLVNGAEYFAINNPNKATLWGVEDTKLYMDNLKVYRDSLKHKEEVDKHLKSISYILSNLKIKIYSKELLGLDSKYTQYKAGNLEFKDYLAYLIQAAKNKIIDIKDFTNIYLLSQTLAEEGNIDFKKADNQCDDLIDKLQKKLSKKLLEELVLKTVEFKSEKISQKDFYVYLTQKATYVGISLNDFPELQKYMVYITMYNTIDKMKVMEEMDGLEGKIKETLYQNDEERSLNKLSKNLAILRNIFNISLTKEDYKYYIDNEQSFDVSNYASFIDKEAPLYKITAQLDKNIIDLDRYREDISKFYEYSFKRDDVFLKNIKFSQGRKMAVVVTGGFHTENLCEMFKKENIAYISIMPAFNNYDGYSCPYFNLLAGNKIGLQEKLYSIFASASSIQIASMLSPAIAPEVWGKANIDVFRAEALIREKIEQGKKVALLKNDGSPLLGKDGHPMVFGEGTEEAITIRGLLDAVHQKDIDGQMEGLSEREARGATGLFEDIKDINNILNDVKDFLKSIGAPENVLNEAEVLKGKNADGRAWVRLVNGITFDGHAGGQGIRINGKFKSDGKEIRAIIIHEIIAGMFGDHFLAERVEQAFRLNHLNANILSHAPPLDMPIWNMTREQRLQIDRDLAANGESLTFDGMSREFKLLLAAMLLSLGSQNTLKAVLLSSGPIMSNARLVETICSKTGLTNNILVKVVNDYAVKSPDIANYLSTVVDMAKKPEYGGKDYSAERQGIVSILRQLKSVQALTVGSKVAELPSQSLASRGAIEDIGKAKDNREKLSIFFSRILQPYVTENIYQAEQSNVKADDIVAGANQINPVLAKLFGSIFIRGPNPGDIPALNRMLNEVLILEGYHAYLTLTEDQRSRQILSMRVALIKNRGQERTYKVNGHTFPVYHLETILPSAVQVFGRHDAGGFSVYGGEVVVYYDGVMVEAKTYARLVRQSKGEYPSGLGQLLVKQWGDVPDNGLEQKIFTDLILGRELHEVRHKFDDILSLKQINQDRTHVAHELSAFLGRAGVEIDGYKQFYNLFSAINRAQKTFVFHLMIHIHWLHLRWCGNFLRKQKERLYSHQSLLIEARMK